MDPHIAEHDLALRWWGYKVAPMSAADRVLFAIENGHYSMDQLARVLNMSRPQISECAQRLARKGSVRRVGVAAWKAVDDERI